MIAALLFAVSLVAPALAQPGDFHGSEVAVRNGERVMVLVEKSQLHCALEEHAVSVKSVRDTLTDGPKDKFTGKRVLLKDATGTVTIIARLPGLKAGPVETVQVDAEEQERRENPTTLHFHGEAWRIEIVGDQLVASTGKRKQVLAAITNRDAMPIWILYWAGDMDHDGKLDLLYDVRGENFTRSELALSSAAKDGELMRVVASENHNGC
jgi:hypothetical protein